MVDPRYTTRPGKPDSPVSDHSWFAPKRFGYGAGMPTCWQGWALIAGYLAALFALHLLDRMGGALPRASAFALFLIFTAALVEITRRKTRGGWRWRWGRGGD